MLWAITLVLDDFDANRGMVWGQVEDLHKYVPFIFPGEVLSSYYVGQDWLPYKNNPIYNRVPPNRPWCDPRDPENAEKCLKEDTWTHSLRGDWSPKFWDKTANQAYHFWFYVAVTYFDGSSWANLANLVHDGSFQEDYDYVYSPENIAPPPSGRSKPDYDLALEGMILGSEFVKNDEFNKYIDECNRFDFINKNKVDVGNWIRSHLK